MKIYVEKIIEMNKIKNSYKESASKKFENYIQNLSINENFISDLSNLLTNKEMEDIYNFFESFSIDINIVAKINGSLGYTNNKLLITKTNNLIFVHLETNAFIYSILNYDCEKKIIEFYSDKNKFETKMPSFLLAKLFFEELELIMQTKVQQTRIKSIYNKNRY